VHKEQVAGARMGGVAAQSLPAALCRQAPAKRPRKPPHPPPGWYVPHNAVYEPVRPPPCGHEHPAIPPPELRPSAKTWDGVRDGGPQEPRDVDLGGFVHTAPPPGSAPPLGHMIHRSRLADTSVQG
jgi:hypothetical protein